jgi:polygalacturonase
LTLNVNVKLNPYNASGNGVTDDRAAIQSAIDDVANAGGGCVYFPAGVYVIGTEPGGAGVGPPAR